jgi:hypothetical protein
MPDFKRLVSYMYTYEEGKKRNNVGYARVEARNGQCKFTIHVSALSYNDKQVTVYAFKRNKNEIEGIQLGKLTFRNEVGDFRLITDPNRILNTGFSIEDIGGIVLYQTGSKYLATVWDENPLTRDMVASLEMKDKNVLKTGESTDIEVDKVVETVIEQVVESVVDQAAETVAEKEEISSEKVAATVAIDSVTLSKEEINRDNTDDDNIEDVVEDKNLEINVSTTDTADNMAESITANTNQFVNAVPEENVHDLSRREESCGCNNSGNPVKDIMNRNQASNSYGNFRASGLEESPIASKLLKEYPRMYPFEDNEIVWCVRIEPKDIGVLPVDVWPLANNSFLLHGFYGHRHLIFAKVNNRNSNSYIIGVPGIYHNRERFMAKMFGFENFKCAKRRDRREGEFGYWYISVNLK